MSEPWPFARRKAGAVRAEMYETDPWAVEAILDVELMTPRVIDPCVGRGIMAEAAAARGYSVHSLDLYDWHYQPSAFVSYSKGRDWLKFNTRQVIGDVEWTCFMNPPFKRTTEFVEHAFAHGARKIVMFQRMAFFEAANRRDFFAKYPLQRMYVCESRATCWRIDIAPAKRKSRSSSTPHSWFIFERGQPAGPLIKRLEKPGT